MQTKPLSAQNITAATNLVAHYLGHRKEGIFHGLSSEQASILAVGHVLVDAARFVDSLATEAHSVAGEKLSIAELGARIKATIEAIPAAEHELIRAQLAEIAAIVPVQSVTD